jgi:hypothetical protein
LAQGLEHEVVRPEIPAIAGDLRGRFFSVPAVQAGTRICAAIRAHLVPAASTITWAAPPVITVGGCPYVPVKGELIGGLL